MKTKETEQEYLVRIMSRTPFNELLRGRLQPVKNHTWQSEALEEYLLANGWTKDEYRDAYTTHQEQHREEYLIAAQKIDDYFKKKKEVGNF